MSVVACKVYKDRIIIGADSFVGFSGDTQLKDKDVKIFRQNGMIVGCVGFARDCALLRLFSKTRKIARPDEEAVLEYIVDFIDWAKKKYNNYTLDSNFILVFSGKAFLITAHLYIKEIKNYESMGAGQDYAMAALMLGRGVKTAIETACELSIYCEKPVNVFEVSR